MCVCVLFMQAYGALPVTMNVLTFVLIKYVLIFIFIFYKRMYIRMYVCVCA